MKSRAYQTTPTPVLDLLPSLLTTKTNRPHDAVLPRSLEFRETFGIHQSHAEGYPTRGAHNRLRQVSAGRVHGGY